MFRSFFSIIFRGSSAVLCAVTIPLADLRSLSLYYYVVCGRMCMSSVRVWCSYLLVICLWTQVHKHVYVICACLVFLSVGDLLVNTSSHADHQQTRTPNTHRWHTHAATYCVILQTQRTQISERNSNDTKHSGGPPEDDHEKRPKHVGVLYLQTRF